MPVATRSTVRMTVDVPLERRLDLRAVAHLAWKVRRGLGQRLDFARRAIHRSENHHQRLGEAVAVYSVRAVN